MALDTNWRENTGIFVCGRSGDDATGDGSKASPYKTLNYAGLLEGKHQLRAGFYSADSIPIAGSNPMSLIGDGQVIIDGSGGTQFFSILSSGIVELNKILIQNGVQSFSIISDNGSVTAFDCIFDNVSFRYKYRNLPSGTAKQSLRCLYKNGSSLRIDKSASTGIFKVFRHTFADTTTVFSATIAVLYQNCFFANNSVFSTSRNDTSFLNTAFEATVTNQCTLNSVNIKDITLDGESNTIGNTYASNIRFSGTATVGGQSVTFTNCFYTDDPMFNDAANEDYTLQTGSPLINEGNIIGCYSVAVRFDATHPAFQVSNGASIDSNITVNGGTFELTSGSTGRVISSPNFGTSLELPYFTYLTEAVQFFGGFNYNNGDWIDEANYNSSTNPEVRLTYKIRVYDESTSTWGIWYDIENFMPVERDSADLGNGDVNADMQNLGAIGGKNFQVDFVIRNNGV